MVARDTCGSRRGTSADGLVPAAARARGGCTRPDAGAFAADDYDMVEPGDVDVMLGSTRPRRRAGATTRYRGYRTVDVRPPFTPLDRPRSNTSAPRALRGDGVPGTASSLPCRVPPRLSVRVKRSPRDPADNGDSVNMIRRDSVVLVFCGMPAWAAVGVPPRRVDVELGVNRSPPTTRSRWCGPTRCRGRSSVSTQCRVPAVPSVHSNVGAVARCWWRGGQPCRPASTPTRARFAEPRRALGHRERARRGPPHGSDVDVARRYVRARSASSALVRVQRSPGLTLRGSAHPVTGRRVRQAGRADHISLPQQHEGRRRVRPEDSSSVHGSRLMKDGSLWASTG